ncbi:hypothetical protein AB0L53_19025 [Nonomuraea sp. NPDC052129]|uniref:hypothetical protein n=1 Tax=Nonomuraea sp. NPDC052129 TaxID=3154651 RepID=UPI00341D8F2E
MLGTAIYGPPALAEPMLLWLRVLVLPALGLTRARALAHQAADGIDEAAAPPIVSDRSGTGR